MGKEFGEKFREKVGIPQHKRRPTREEVATYRVRALRLPSDIVIDVGNNVKVDRAAVVIKLDQARDEIWKPVGDDNARLQTITEAKKIIADIQPLIIGLEKVATGKPKAPGLTLPPPDPKLKENASQLQEKLQLLLGEVKKSETILRAFQLPAELSYDGFLQRCATIGQRIGDDVIGNPTAEKLKRAMLEIEEGLSKARSEAAKLAKIQTDMTDRLRHLQNLVKPLQEALKKEGVDPLVAFPDLSELRRYEIGITGKPSPIANADFQNKFGELAERLEKADALKGNVDDNAKELSKTAKAEKAAEPDRKIFKENAYDQLSSLIDLSALFEAERPTALEDEYATLLQSVGLPNERGIKPDPDTVAKEFNKKTQKEIDTLQLEFDKLAKEASELKVKVDQKLDKARKDTGHPKHPDVLVLDWKRIDSMALMFAAQIDKSKSISASAVKNLRAALSLGETIEEQIKELYDKNTPPAIKSDFVAFNGKLVSLQDDLTNNNAGPKSPLATYFPDLRSEFESKIKELVKTYKTLTAEAAIEELNEIRKHLDKKVVEASTLHDTVAKANTDLGNKKKEYEKLKKEAKKPGVATKLKEPNEVTIAVEALTAALKQTPPIQKLIEDASGALTRIDLTGGTNGVVILLNGRADDAQKKHEEQQATAKKELEVVLAKQREVKAAIEDARIVVKEAGGDLVALKAIQAMFIEAERQIKSKNTQAALPILSNILNRCDTLITHPEGEVNRARDELPKLFAEWRSMLSNVGSTLATAIEMLNSYQPDDQGNTKATQTVTKFATLLEAYRKEFTEASGDLVGPLSKLTSPDTPDPGRRKAREAALAEISKQMAALQKHPLSKVLATSPLPGASAVPGLLNTGLSRLQYTALTSVR